ncbi:MAG TPA: DnaJ domain-containing protein [Thermodesulfobacteriota bacterium]|nr:DnaJ domain-containing protein [Thermodesulfobacteriota bacterium]
MQQKDYYKILGVDSKASQKQIKEAYRKLAFEYHPDRNNNRKSASDRMKEINEAYSVLSDPYKRKQYDALYTQYGSSGYDRFRQTYNEDDIFRGSDINRIFDEFAKKFGFRNADEIFRDLYGSKSQTFEFRGPGFSVRGFFVFDSAGRPRVRQRADGASGSLKSPIFSGVVGKLAEYALKKITGIKIPEKGTNMYDVIHITPQQARRGVELIYSYRNNGKQKELAVKIPPGIKDGQKLRLKGLGSPGKDGGEPGDLYIKVKVGDSLSTKVKSFLNNLGLQRT